MCLNESSTKVISVVTVILGFVGVLLGFFALFTGWTDYRVADGLVVRVNSSQQLDELYEQWPQVFYTRSRKLHEFCFPDMDKQTWRRVFGRKPGRRCSKNSCTIVYCLTEDEYNTPNASSVHQHSTDRRVKQQSHLVSATLVLVIIDVILSFAVFLTPIAAPRPRTAGAILASLILLKECVISSVLITYSFADKLEETITVAPHYGFVRNNTELASATTRFVGAGFWLAVSVLALTAVHVILYLLIWCSYLIQDDDNCNRCARRCCCCSEAFDEQKSSKLLTSSVAMSYGTADSDLALSSDNVTLVDDNKTADVDKMSQ